MSWASIANNQAVSCNNLQDAVTNGVFTLVNAIPVSSKEITKAEAGYYVCLNTGASPFSTKTNNQLVIKSDLVACTPGAVTLTLTMTNIGNTFPVFRAQLSASITSNLIVDRVFGDGYSDTSCFTSVASAQYNNIIAQTVTIASGGVGPQSLTPDVKTGYWSLGTGSAPVRYRIYNVMVNGNVIGVSGTIINIGGTNVTVNFASACTA